LLASRQNRTPSCWLRSLGLEQYEATFRANAVEADVLQDLTDQDLEKLGIVSCGRAAKVGWSLNVASSIPPDSAEAAGELSCLAVVVEARFASILRSALERATICSNDPVCADHEPDDRSGDRATHGAACHGCLLIAETSCEMRNLFLDRNLLVPTMAIDGAEFFEIFGRR
jgi:hypothetical protein